MITEARRGWLRYQRLQFCSRTFEMLKCLFGTKLDQTTWRKNEATKTWTGNTKTLTGIIKSALLTNIWGQTWTFETHLFPGKVHFEVYRSVTRSVELRPLRRTAGTPGGRRSPSGCSGAALVVGRSQQLGPGPLGGSERPSEPERCGGPRWRWTARSASSDSGCSCRGRASAGAQSRHGGCKERAGSGRGHALDWPSRRRFPWDSFIRTQTQELKSAV